MNIAVSRPKSLLLFVVVAACASVRAWGAAAPDSLTLGRQYTALFYAGETDRIWQVFSPEMKKVLGSAEALKEFRDKVIQQTGQETSVLSEHVQPSGSGALIYERLASFSAAPSPWLVQWALESDGTVTGFTIQPAPSQGALSSGALPPAGFNWVAAPMLPASLTGQASQSLPRSTCHPGACCCPNTPAKTARLEGRGPNCAAAVDNLSILTDDQVAANCAIGSDGVCREGNVIITIACAYNTSERGYSVTGYRAYTCMYC